MRDEQTAGIFPKCKVKSALSYECQLRHPAEMTALPACASQAGQSHSALCPGNVALCQAQSTFSYNYAGTDDNPFSTTSLKAAEAASEPRGPRERLREARQA